MSGVVADRLMQLHDQVVRTQRRYLGAQGKTAGARNAYFLWRDAERKFAAAIARLAPHIHENDL